jgi:hypothetical protein
VGSPQWARMSRTVGPSVMKAMIRMAAPPREHTSGKASQMRASEQRERRSGRRHSPPGCGRAGTTPPRAERAARQHPAGRRRVPGSSAGAWAPASSDPPHFPPVRARQDVLRCSGSRRRTHVVRPRRVRPQPRQHTQLQRWSSIGSGPRHRTSADPVIGRARRCR